MLEVNSVSRSFGERAVLSNVSFGVRPGRMTGFVGSNGSGKTTTMRIILGVLDADHGDVTWRGRPVTAAMRQRIGYMPEERGLYPKMKVAEQIAWLGQMHGLSQTAARRNTQALLDELELSSRAGDPLEQLSLGNQQRAQIAAALVHDPVLLILDEPFSGLDPVAVDTVLDVLRRRSASGVPVLFSSHQLDVVERLCDDMVIIADGSIPAQGEREELRMRFATPRFELITDSDAGWLRDVPGITVVDIDGPRAVFDLPHGRMHGGTSDQDVLRAALHRGAVRGFQRVVPSLGEIFKETLR